MPRQLTVEDVPAVELADRFGTPLFAISENAIRERYRRTLAAVRTVYDPVDVYYAVKSNPILAVRRILATEGAGGDAFGPGEVETSLRAGVPGGKLVMNGQAKTREWLELAVKNGITVTIDNPGELELLLEVAEQAKQEGWGRVPAPAFLRLKLPMDEVRASVTPEGPQIADRVLATVWGLTEDEAREAVPRALGAPDRLLLRGYHHHIGYFINRPDYHAAAMRDVVGAIARLREATGFVPGVLDVGGGWAYPSDPESGDETPHEVAPPEEFAAVQLGALGAAFDAAGIPRPLVLFELGRSLVGESTVLLARVQWVKEQYGRRFVITDAQKHLLMRACIEGYKYRWVKADDLDAPPAGPAELFGPTCTDDELALGYAFPAVRRGDVVAALACGAYAQTFNASLNSMTRPAVVLVNGKDAGVVVRREIVDDVLARYELPDWLT
jgi:diaminopimelate decarboxylase